MIVGAHTDPFFNGSDIIKISYHHLIVVSTKGFDLLEARLDMFPFVSVIACMY